MRGISGVAAHPSPNENDDEDEDDDADDDDEFDVPLGASNRSTSKTSEMHIPPSLKCMLWRNVLSHNTEDEKDICRTNICRGSVSSSCSVYLEVRNKKSNPIEIRALLAKFCQKKAGVAHSSRWFLTAAPSLDHYETVNHTRAKSWLVALKMGNAALDNVLACGNTSDALKAREKENGSETMSVMESLSV